MISTQDKTPYLYSIGIAIVVLLSFFSFSEIGNPYLDSDDALNVLMAWQFDTPETWYCWGQDRGGSVVPMFGHFIISLTGMTPIWATAIAHFLLNLFGYIGFAQFIKSNWLKLLLALIWFMPPFHFYSFVLYPMGTQYCMIGIGLIFYQWYKQSPSTARQMFHFSAFCISLVMSVWASDMAIVNIGSLALAISFITIKEKGFRIYFFSKESILLLLWTFVGILFILHGKEYAHKNMDYTGQLVNSLDDFVGAVSIVYNSLLEMYTFNSVTPLMSVYTWAATITLVLFALLYPKKNKLQFNNWYLLFITLNALAILGALFTANWVYHYGEMARRYFTTLYIAIGILIVYLLDKSAKKELLIHLSLVVTIIAGIVSTKYQYYEYDLEPKYNALKSLKQLQPAGIVGGYWNSYVLGTYNPDSVLATPREGDVNRRNEITNAVFYFDNLYLVKDNWLDEFPSQIIQYGYKLKKTGEPFELVNSTFCKYQRIPYDTLFTIDKFNHIGVVQSDSIGDPYLQTPDSIGNKLFTMGPYFTLGKGKYKAEFLLKYVSNDTLSNKTIATIDATANWGNFLLKQKDVAQNNLIGSEFSSIELMFELDEYKRDLELKIWPKFGSNGQILFKGVRLTQIEN